MAEAQHSTRLAELDALRGIAAIAVVLFHFTWRAHDMAPKAPVVPYGLAWGSYGVHLFFAISGFVIFMTLEKTRASADFAVHRFARLFPAYWAGIAVTTLAVHLLDATAMAQPAPIVVVNLTMLQGFAYLPAVDGVYWSLTVELAFYLCMWLLWRAQLLGRIELVLLGWLALKLLWWLVPALPSRLALVLALDYITFFAIGIATYRVWSGERGWLQQAPLLVCGFGATLVTGGSETALVFAIVLAIFLALATGWLAILTHPVLLWLGALSYPIYLVHQNLGYAVLTRLGDIGWPAWAALPITIAIALGVAQLIHSFVEKPALTAIRSAWRRQRENRLQPST